MSIDNDEIDRLWSEAYQSTSIYGEKLTRYHFAKLVSKYQMEQDIKAMHDFIQSEVGWNTADACAAAIRLIGQWPGEQS